MGGTSRLRPDAKRTNPNGAACLRQLSSQLRLMLRVVRDYMHGVVEDSPSSLFLVIGGRVHRGRAQGAGCSHGWVSEGEGGGTGGPATRRLTTGRVANAARAQISATIAIVAEGTTRSATRPACKLTSGIMPPKINVQMPMTRPRIPSETMVCNTVLEVEK